MTTYPALPTHVRTVLFTGSGGWVGNQVAQHVFNRYPSLKLVLADLRPPPLPVGEGSEQRCESVGADLCDTNEVKKLFEGRDVDLVFAFQGIMSGQSEKDFDFGYRVNVDSHRNLLEECRRQGQNRENKIIYVYTSGLAVFGGPDCLPEAFVDPMTTPLFPETSYGTAKAITELYAFDYARKNFVDTRILRLPTVAIRAGAPSSAASSFISGMIREPLQGLPSECPVATGLDDTALDTVPIYLSRAITVFDNIIFAATLPASAFPSYSRTVGVPGIKVTPRQIVDALKEVGGQEALDLVTFKPDAAVINIMKAWPGNFDNTVAKALGFKEDDPKTGFMLAVQDFKNGLSKK